MTPDAHLDLILAHCREQLDLHAGLDGVFTRDLISSLESTIAAIEGLRGLRFADDSRTARYAGEQLDKIRASWPVERLTK